MVDITPILTSALQLVAAIFTIMGTFAIKAYVIPWFKAKLSKEQQDSIKNYIESNNIFIYCIFGEFYFNRRKII